MKTPPAPLSTALVDAGGRMTRPWSEYIRWILDRAASAGVRIGTHADRPPATEFTPGAEYWETDRTARYQVQDVGGGARAWVWVGGEMRGLLTPDQRPTDLGVRDVGFLFRSTDEQRTLRWNGLAWEDIWESGLIAAGPYAARLAFLNPAPGLAWFETDRLVWYVATGSPLQWRYAGGTMLGYAVTRPTGLGPYDVGFRFCALETGQHEWWDGTSWQPEGGSAETNTAVSAEGTGTLLLSSSFADVPGAAVLLDRAGTWLIFGSVSIQGDSADGPTLVALLCNGMMQLGYMQFGGEAISTISRVWVYAATGPCVAHLQAMKAAGSGASMVWSQGTSITAVWLGP